MCCQLFFVVVVIIVIIVIVVILVVVVATIVIVVIWRPLHLSTSPSKIRGSFNCDRRRRRCCCLDCVCFDQSPTPTTNNQQPTANNHQRFAWTENLDVHLLIASCFYLFMVLLLLFLSCCVCLFFVLSALSSCGRRHGFVVGGGDDSNSDLVVFSFLSIGSHLVPLFTCLVLLVCAVFRFVSLAARRQSALYWARQL